MQLTNLYCSHCMQLITGEYTVAGDKKYHTACYKNFIELKCTVCRQGISGTYYNDEWGNNVCARHTLRNCNSCNRIITNPDAKPVNTRYYCTKCMAVAVNSNVPATAAALKILNIYTKYGILNVPVSVPVQVIDKASLISLSNSVNTGDILGLAVTNTTWQGVQNKNFKHTIYILGGMPLIEFEAVMAHELLHTWLNQYEVKMPELEIEGFCNLGSYLILTLNASKHAQILMKRIKEDKSTIYGTGFRQKLAEVQQKGWLQFLNDIKNRR